MTISTVLRSLLGRSGASVLLVLALVMSFAPVADAQISVTGTADFRNASAAGAR